MAILFTKEGYEKIKSELETLEEKRPEAVITLTRARAMGDLSENGFYKSAKFELNELDRKIRELKYLIKDGNIIPSPTNNDKVQIGHTIILEREN